MARPSMFEFAGGEEAFLALAAAHHERCLQDPELNHPLSRMRPPTHVWRPTCRRLAGAWPRVTTSGTHWSGIEWI
jgi:hemoglobin